MSEYLVHAYESGEEMDGQPSQELIQESLAAGHTGAVKAAYDRETDTWQYVPAESAGPDARTVYVMES